MKKKKNSEEQITAFSRLKSSPFFKSIWRMFISRNSVEALMNPLLAFSSRINDHQATQDMIFKKNRVIKKASYNRKRQITRNTTG